MAAAQHYVANSVVTVDGDEATNTVFDIAFIAPKGIAEGDSVRIASGVWEFHVTRRDGTWTIRRLVSEMVFQSPWLDDMTSFPAKGPKPVNGVTLS